MSSLEVKNGEVYQAREPLQQLLKQPLPVKVAYGLTKLARKIGEQYADIEAVRIKLVTEHGAKNENGQITITPSSDNWATFAASFNELMDTSVTLENVWRVKLPSDNGLEMSAEHLMLLDPFVEVEGEES